MMDRLPPGLPVSAYANPLGVEPAPLVADDPLDALPSGMRDYLALQPVPPTTPDLLGLDAPPAPPAPPPVLGPKGSNIGELVALAMAAFLGPGKGTGLLQGVQASRMQAEQARQQLAAQHQQIFAQRQRMFQWEAQQYEADARRRQETLEQNVRALQAELPKLKTQEEYDAQIDTFAAGLQAMGLRVDGNYLRSRVGAFHGPKAVDRLRAALDAYVQRQDKLKEPVDADAFIVYRDNEGRLKKARVAEAVALTEYPGLAFDEQNKLMPTGTARPLSTRDQEVFRARVNAEMAKIGASGFQMSEAEKRDEAIRRVGKQMDAEDRAAKTTPKEPKAPDKEWIIRNGQPMQIDKGTAQPGDRPYNAADAKFSATAGDAAAKRTTMAEKVLGAITALETSTGFSGAIGAPSLTQPGSWTRAIGISAMPGSSAASARAALQRLMALIAIPELQSMRGLGAMSDREFATISAAGSSLTPDMSEADARRELQRLREVFTPMASGASDQPPPSPSASKADPLGIR